MREFQSNKIPTSRVEKIDVFSGNSPLDIEIGCGVGMHALSYTLQHPERSLIAIDKSRIRMGKLLATLDRSNGRPNLIPVRDNAVWFVTHQVIPGSVENYFFLYPNPYPKKKQANKRWYQMPFMKQVISTLKTNGRIHFATNMKFYAEEALHFMVDVWGLTLIENRSIVRSEQFVPRTHFEKKYVERGEVCWNLVFEKSEKAVD